MSRDMNSKHIRNQIFGVKNTLIFLIIQQLADDKWDLKSVLNLSLFIEN